MQIHKEKKYTLLVQDNESIDSFRESLIKKLTTFKNQHLILNFSNTISSQEINTFLNIANNKQKQSTSFVILYKDIDIDTVLDEIQIAPTLEEAIAIIDMDAMAREIGF